MLRKSTLLFVSIFFLLFIGLNTPSYACHQGRPPHGNQISCDDSDSDDTKFSVAIKGAVSGGSGQDWSGGQGGKVVAGNSSQIDIGSLTDLSFFRLPKSAGGPFSDTRGVNCFRERGDPPTLEVDFFPQVILKQGRGGRADSSFWFIGSTDNKELQTEVLYVLSGFGQFEGSSDPIWPPSKDDTTFLVITDWELRVENEGRVIKNLSCIGGGKFADFAGVTDDAMVIAVTRNQ